MIAKKILLISLLVMITLAACATPTAETPKATVAPPTAPAAPATSAPTTVAATLAPAPKTKITFWYALSGAQGKVIEDMVAKYNQTSKTAQVEVVFQGSYADIAQKLTAAITAKTVPDVAQMGGAPTLGESGAIVPVADLVSDADKKDIFDGFWDYNKFNGKVVSMPFNNSTPMLYYNKDMFTAAGLDPNKPPTTWDELVTAAKALTKDTNGDGKPDQWGGKILSDDGKKVIYNSPEGIEALQFWGDLVTKHKVMPPNQHAQAGADFTTGKLGMIMRSSSFLATVEKDAKFKVGVAILPGKKVKSVPIGGASLLVFKTTAERQKAAWEFVQWMTNAENSLSLFTQTNYVPIRKSVASMPAVKDYIAKSPNSEVLIKQLEFASAIPIFAELGNSDEQLRKAVEKVELGSGTAKDALDVAASVINKALGGP
ncbi:MAG: ABC transporter substrate-binding protein [Chloroflexi bacterium]|nr:ABC transporter substrate-binding protein [Chloroflexota bacterium]